LDPTILRAKFAVEEIANPDKLVVNFLPFDYKRHLFCLDLAFAVLVGVVGVVGVGKFAEKHVFLAPNERFRFEGNLFAQQGHTPVAIREDGNHGPRQKLSVWVCPFTRWHFLYPPRPSE